ncbi:hypothetical protein [Pseudomonas sp. H9]|uniref:hypothetical protein n=1 Tax=Pseudomonas sp. H9 TaxID=483968 RepID=UPI001057E914|nr:hypothetical protein [Pseudomonas sp. H9]TDF86318.1 hypothetical protein E1573_01765 [Pseudomonas sp. H9]
MQVQTPKVSAAQANTSPTTRPRLASSQLDLPSICDVCGKARSTRKHQRCSQIRQQRKSIEWATYMANVEAKRALGGRRYVR